MDTQSILTLPQNHRRTFVVLLIALFTIALLLDWVLGTLPFIETLLGYIRAIAAAIITSLFLLWVVSSFIPRKKNAEGMIELEAAKITKEFDKLLSTATRWRYKGNFGRYMRGKVLPTLADRQNCHISACVIDPNNKALCEKHASYRSQINSIDKGEKYDANIVALQILVTVVICSWYSNNRRVTIDLYLSASFDPVRIDSNDEAMIITVEDRKQPALKINRDHFIYEHFETSMEFARDQGAKVNLDGMRRGIEFAQIEESDVFDALEKAGMTELCKKITPAIILRACRESKNPYEN